MSKNVGLSIVYYRSKSYAFGAVLIGAVLLAMSFVVLTRDSLYGIPFSADLIAMSTYLLLPLGAVMVLAHIGHLLNFRPSVTANPDGIEVHFTRKPVGLIRWTEIAGFKPFTVQGRWGLGIVLEEPKRTLPSLQAGVLALIWRAGPRDAHLKIAGKMLDEPVEKVVYDLAEMRKVYSWRA